jgi:hypothetical protein
VTVLASRQNTGLLIVGMGGLFVLGSVAIATYQSYVWLRYGFWPGLPIGSACFLLDVPLRHSEWAGIEKFLNWFYEQPTSVTFFSAGMITVLAGVKIADD